MEDGSWVYLLRVAERNDYEMGTSEGGLRVKREWGKLERRDYLCAQKNQHLLNLRRHGRKIDHLMTHHGLTVVVGMVLEK